MIQSYLNNVHMQSNNAMDDYYQYYKITKLLAYNHRSELIFFIGQSLTKSGDESLVTEQDLRSNVYVFSVAHGTVHCVTCQLDVCYRNRQDNAHSPCIGNRAFWLNAPEWNN